MSKRTAKPPVTSSALDMTATRWKFVTGPEFNYSNVNMPVSPEQVALDSWKYNLPLTPGKIGYLLCPHNQPITVGSITGEFELVGDGIVQDAKEPWGTICTFRFCIYRDLTTARGRWWATTGIDLNAQKNTGIITLTVPFSLDRWTSVSGEKASDYPADFAACLNAPTNVAITHGAGDYGHGLKLLSGTLTVIAKGIKLI